MADRCGERGGGTTGILSSVFNGIYWLPTCFPAPPFRPPLPLFYTSSFLWHGPNMSFVRVNSSVLQKKKKKKILRHIFLLLLFTFLVFGGKKKMIFCLLGSSSSHFFNQEFDSGAFFIFERSNLNDDESLFFFLLFLLFSLLSSIFIICFSIPFMPHWLPSSLSSVSIFSFYLQLFPHLSWFVGRFITERNTWNFKAFLIKRLTKLLPKNRMVDASSLQFFQTSTTFWNF